MIPIFKDGTVSGERINNDIRIPHIYRGLTINDTSDPTNHYEVGWTAYRPNFDSVVEPYAQRDGMEAYEARRISALVQVRGIIRAPSFASLMDKADLLNAVFDPVNAYASDTGPESVNRGFRSYLFDYPTADTANYPTGVIPMQMYLRSRRLPVDIATMHNGLTLPFLLDLEAADPRRYLQNETVLNRANAGALVLDNSLSSYMSWPKITLNITGGTMGRVRLLRTASSDSRSLYLDLTGLVPGDIIVVDCARRKITKNGVENMSFYWGGDYWWMTAGESNTLTISNETNAPQVTYAVTWRRAFV